MKQALTTLKPQPELAAASLPPAKDMIAVIRTTPGRLKYCGGTVDALIASDEPDEHHIIIQASCKTPNENGIAALQRGIEASKGHPFIFLEDDVRFIRHFTRSVTAFTNACKGLYSAILPLCANYETLLKQCRGVAWKYPVRLFYGTQAFVIRPADAEDFIRYYREREKTEKMPPAGFDMRLKEWAESKGQKLFLTPYRSFVQHIGVESSLHSGRFHHYSTWGGPDWEFRTGSFSLDEQRNRPCDKALASIAAEWFGSESTVYDFGCSTGNYLREFRGHGIHARGFDATPGLQSEEIDELDLARPQTFAEPPGNVLCLEVAEHIHPEDEKHMLANITALCADKLILSWAVPGQGGVRHVNEQEASYVNTTMLRMGFMGDAAMQQRLRDAATIKWFKSSVYAFRRAERQMN